MRELHIVLPMAGRGSRFANAGFTTPKPLIQVDGLPMFLKALSSLDNIPAKKRYTIIIREEHELQYGLSKLLQETLEGVNVIVTNEIPTGAATDAYRAKATLSPDEGVIVLDCDLWFQSKSYSQLVTEALNNTSKTDGVLLTFSADNPRYSYARYGSDKVVTETAEKRAISDRAITGAYFFSTAQTFLHACETLLQQPLTPDKPEYYLSFLYNILIHEGKIIQAAEVDDFASFGTPEELADYEAKRKA